jgi:hypothetical protein
MAPRSDDEHARGSVEAKLEELEGSILSVNEALFRIVGVFARVIVDAGLLSKDELAAMIEDRAGHPGYDDHLPTLVTFARAIRMNLPGGRFDVIDGGRSDDPTPS